VRKWLCNSDGILGNSFGIILMVRVGYARIYVVIEMTVTKPRNER